MGLFGFGKAAEPAYEGVSPLAAARAAYESLQESLPPERLILNRLGDAPAFPAAQYYFACTETEFLFLEKPDMNQTDPEVYRACAVRRLPRGDTAVVKPRMNVEPDAQQGLLQHYKAVPLTLQFAREGVGEARFSCVNINGNLRYLQKNLPACAPLPLFDLFGQPEKTYAVHCQEGGGLLPNGAPLDVWREGEQLALTRRAVNYYSTPDGLWYGTLPVKDILHFRGQGQIEYETRVSGGEVNIDSAGATLGSFIPTLTFGKQLQNIVEYGVEVTPVTSTRVEHDNRFAELMIKSGDKTAALRFGYDALQAFQALIPEKAFDRQALSLREPTVAEQIEILADVCARGYLTRAEFEEAKRKLLERL